MARVLECSFSARINEARCASRSAGPLGTELWTVEVSGELTGCGEEVAFISVHDLAITDECGSWGAGVFGGCVPPDDDLSTTKFAFKRTIEREARATSPIEVRVWRGHGDVTLTTAAIACE